MNGEEEEVREAIGFVKGHEGGLEKLRACPQLGQAAADHYCDIAVNGLTSHTGSDGCNYKDRIEKYSLWGGAIYEAIVYK